MNFSGARYPLLIFLLSIASGCGGLMGTHTPIDRVLNGGKRGDGGIDLKAKPQCANGLMAAQLALKGSGTNSNASLRLLPNGTCAVMVRMASHRSALAAANVIKAANGFYSFIPAPGTAGPVQVPVWYDEAPRVYPPVHDSSGNVLDSALTVGDCTVAAPLLNQSLPTGAADVSMTLDNTSLGPCYITASFKTTAAFESFMTTPDNPSLQLFYWGLTRANGTGISVPIYAFYKPL